MEYTKGISIIVPTEGRFALISELLCALVAAREKFDSPSEIIIIDSSDDDDKTLLADACKRYDARLINGSQNVREKRNLGIKNAQFSVVLFLDSDCRPTADLLAEHWKHYDQPSLEEKLGGVIGKTIFEGEDTWVWRMVRYSSLVTQFTIADEMSTVTWGPTSNISFRHDVLDQMEGFDTNLPFRLGGDDLDLSYRITQTGFTIVSEPKAIVYHSKSTWNSLHSILSRAFRWGRMEYHLYQKHPEARSIAPPGFWGWAIYIGALFSFQAVILDRMALIMFLLFFLWGGGALCLFSIFSALDIESSLKNKISLFTESFLIGIPELTYQLGTTWEFVKHGDFRFLWSRAWFDPDAPKNNWLFEAWNIWSNMGMLLFCQLLMLLFY